MFKQHTLPAVCLTLALTMAFTAGHAEAAMVLIIDTGGTEVTITDNDFNDINEGVGTIAYNGPVGPGLNLLVTGVSSPGGQPGLLLDVDFNSNTNFEIWLTDTDFGIAATSGTATTIGDFQVDSPFDEGTATFEYFGDTGNGEFVEGFLVGSESYDIPGDIGINILEGPAADVGSLTIKTRFGIDFVGDYGGSFLTEYTVVPIPAAAWLFGSALGLLGWVKRRARLN